jgi:predicted metal-dependent hydrolase
MDEHTRDKSVEPPPTGQNPSGWLPTENRWEHDTLRQATIHGVRLTNAGDYHEAHDCFEDEWFNYGNGTLEKSFLQGMTQVAAGAYKYTGFDNTAGLRKLLDSAHGYLVGVPADFYGVDVAALRDDILAIRRDPSRADSLLIAIDGQYPSAREVDLGYAASLP